MEVVVVLYIQYSVIKNEEILPVVPTWMDLESTMLNEISQRQTLYDLYVDSKEQNKTSHQTKKKRSYLLLPEAIVEGRGIGIKWSKRTNGTNFQL